MWNRTTTLRNVARPRSILIKCITNPIPCTIVTVFTEAGPKNIILGLRDTMGNVDGPTHVTINMDI